MKAWQWWLELSKRDRPVGFGITYISLSGIIKIAEAFGLTETTVKKIMLIDDLIVPKWIENARTKTHS